MRNRRAMTLFELILVMTLLVILLATSAPALGRFFSGRGQVEEARRLLALTRFARAEAIERSARAELWLEPAEGRYGLLLHGIPSDAELPERHYQIDERLELRVFDEYDEPLMERAAITFWPDGALDASSPRSLAIRDRDGHEIPLAPSLDGLGYVIEEARHEQVY